MTGTHGRSGVGELAAWPGSVSRAGPATFPAGTIGRERCGPLAGTLRPGALAGATCTLSCAVA